jgi:uncharacterized protein YdiU (UPF0061 family)
MAAAARDTGLARLAACCDYSWLRQLLPDPETERHAPNQRSREVRAGHYVEVLPAPLPAPTYVAHSPAMAAELGLAEKDVVGSEAFAQAFSGDIGAAPGFRSWATPYALSIFGQRMYRQCPFGNGNGYGDGRAISIAEVLVPPLGGGAADARRWELQLKGGGPTPFCRGADGRAVLRSSVREFLVSEAMHALGVSTTRALSLVVSGGERVNRPWYRSAHGGDGGGGGGGGDGGGGKLPTVDDPRLARYPPEVRLALIEQLRQQMRDPDVMQSEPCAITCRVAPSFLRVGHLELHARRAAGEDDEPTGGGATGAERRDALERIVRHALEREFAGVDEPDAALERRILLMLREARRRLAQLAADWVRVGFVQGNFNSDNCLVGGRTMDYGPFGFIELYDPMWNMWSGGGEHFAFMNQPGAAAKNFETLVSAVLPLLGGPAAAEAREISAGFGGVSAAALGEVWRRKLGLSVWDTEAEGLFAELERLMRAEHGGAGGTPGGVDWTLLWRQLAAAAELAVPPSSGMASVPDAVELLALLEPAFYTGAAPQGSHGELWRAWLRRWAGRLAEDAAGGAAQQQPGGAAAVMRAASPKYVPREWMLVDAYSAAHEGDYAPLRQLQALFERPFDEQPEHEAAFYRRRPDGVAERGGTAFMS